MSENTERINSDFSNEQEKLAYLQEKVHEISLNFLNTYSLLTDKMPLIETFLAQSYMVFRTTGIRNIKLPQRKKSSYSALKNLESEILSHLANLPENCTKQDIDNMVNTVISKVTKDFFGATLVVNMQNDIKKYCISSDDPEVARLFSQYECVQSYLTKSDESHKRSSFFSSFLKRIPIRKSFIDNDGMLENKKIPQKIPAFNITSVNTPKQYYEQLIGLLTLSTNCSMICTDTLDEKQKEQLPNAKIRRAVAQSDISYLKLVEQAKSYNPKNNDEWILLLTLLAHNTYFLDANGDYIDRTELDPNKQKKSFDEQIDEAKKYNKSYIPILEEFQRNAKFITNNPFDIQLDEALKEYENAKKSKVFNTPFANEQIRLPYIHRLEHLKNNLEKMSSSRLLHYIGTKEMVDVLKKMSDINGFNIELLSEKDKCKINGYYSHYYKVLINGIVLLEFQVQDEFSNKQGAEGPSSHNTAISGKMHNIMEFIELNEETATPFISKEKQLKFYADFLDSINLNYLSAYNFEELEPENYEYLEILKNLVSYASSKLKVKDSFSYKSEINGVTCSKKVPFIKYILSTLNFKGANFGSFYPINGIESNQALHIEQNILYTFENLFKGRIGFSALANLVRAEIKNEYSKQNQPVPSKNGEPPHFYSLGFAGIDVTRAKFGIKHEIDEYTIDEFYPQGGEYQH